MNATIVVREAGVVDSAPVALLLTELNETVGVNGLPAPECYAPANVIVTPEVAQRRLERIDGVEVVFLAEVDGEPAGFTALRLVPYLDQDVPYAEITQMYVRPEFRRRHIGAGLVEAAESRAQVAGATCVHIITNADDNEAAQAFYRGVGYRIIGVDFEKHLANSETA
jgi:ribosomal protein S18 acetylase RimI-like enzyme